MSEPQIIDVPGHGPVEFPAGMSDADITAAIKKNLLTPKQYKIGVEGLPDAAKAVIGDFNPLSQAAIGTKGFVDDAAMRLKQLFGGDLTQEDQTAVKVSRAVRQESPMATVGDIGGAMALPVGALYRGVAGLASGILPKAAGILAPTVGAATVGATVPALTSPNLPGESTMKKAEEGGIVGAVVDAALRGGARAIKPLTASPNVQALLNADIKPTMGQAADTSLTGRMMKWGEEKLTSVPVLGDIIKNARLRPFDEVNLAAIKTVDPTATEIGHKGIAKAEDYVGGLYQSALGQFKNGVSPDQKFLSAAVRDIPATPNYLITEEQKKQYTNFVRGVILDKSWQSSGSLSPEVAKKIESELGTKIRELRGSQSASEKDLGRAFQDLQTEFRGLMERNAPTPEAYAALKEANARWANFVRVRDAAASVGARDGVFTPAQLQAAVRRGDHSAGKGSFAKGEALGQDLSGPAKSVLGDTLPNPTTADRLFFAHMLTHPGSAALGLSAAIPTAALYSRAGQRYMLGDLPGQGILSSGVRGLAPYGAAAGGILGPMRAQQEQQ